MKGTEAVPSNNIYEKFARAFDQIERKFIRNSALARWCLYLYKTKLLPLKTEAINRKKTSGKVNNLIPFPKNRDEWFSVFGKPKNNLWKEAWEFTEHSIIEMRNYAESMNVKFTLVMVPDSVQIFYKMAKNDVPERHGELDFLYPNRRLREFSKNNNIQFLDPWDFFAEYFRKNKLPPPYFSFDNDGHYSSLGHKIMADFLSESNSLR